MHRKYTEYEQHLWKLVGDGPHKWCPACGAVATELGLDMPAGYQVTLPEIAKELEYLHVKTESSAPD